LSPYPEAPISRDAVADWISYVPTLLLDKRRPTPETLAQRLSSFWLPDETVLYIGKAARSLKVGVGQYYRTRLGDRKPHAGGCWLKTLSILDQLTVFWACTEHPEQAEANLLSLFTGGVSHDTKSILRDSEHCFPFANLEYPKGTTKAHGISGPLNRSKSPL